MSKHILRRRLVDKSSAFQKLQTLCKNSLFHLVFFLKCAGLYTFLYERVVPAKPMLHRFINIDAKNQR